MTLGKERKGEASLCDPTHPSRSTARAGPGRRSCPPVGAHHLFGWMCLGAEHRLVGATEMVGTVGWIASMALLRHPVDVRGCVAPGGSWTLGLGSQMTCVQGSLVGK